jgi:hypothetical protein
VIPPEHVHLFAWALSAVVFLGFVALLGVLL